MYKLLSEVYDENGKLLGYLRLPPKFVDDSPKFTVIDGEFEILDPLINEVQSKHKLISNENCK